MPLRLLNKLAPKKQKFAKNNQSFFRTEEVRKAIITRSRQRNKFLI